MRHTTEHKTRKNLCATKFCRNTRETRSSLCSKCRKRLYKERHPVQYTYSYVKANARRRKKEWSLTMEEFLDFVTSTGYMIGKGRTGDKLSIDRIDHRQGYHLGNIQVMTVSANSIKAQLEKDCPF